MAKLCLKPEQLLSKLLKVLCSDFYKPFDVFTLHSQLFPENFFDPLYSSMKIHQLVRRLRLHLKAQKIPLSIKESQGVYSIQISPKLGIQVAARFSEKLSITKDQKLREHFGCNLFRLSQVQALLQIPARSASRHLNGLVDSGEVVRYNKARATQYQFIDPKA